MLEYMLGLFGYILDIDNVPVYAYNYELIHLEKALYVWFIYNKLMIFKSNFILT